MEKEVKTAVKKRYLVQLRNDNGAVSHLKAIIESDENPVRLAQHAHILEVFGEVKYTGEIPQGPGKGFAEVSEDEATKLLEGITPAREDAYEVPEVLKDEEVDEDEDEDTPKAGKRRK